MRSEKKKKKQEDQLEKTSVYTRKCQEQTRLFIKLFFFFLHFKAKEKFVFNSVLRRHVHAK